MKLRAMILFTTTMAFTAGLGSIPGQEPAKGAALREVKGVTIREVNPSDTDKKIDKFTGAGHEHLAYFKKEGQPKGQLVVFIPGTGGNGHGGAKFCMEAAAEGYHVVALTYPSNLSVSTIRSSKDPLAFQKARENIIHGKQSYLDFKITEENSIENRLHKLIEYLAAADTEQQWNQYLTKKDGLAWGKMVLSGQSQGAGHAGFIAIQRKVARVVMFGGPKDYNVTLDKSGAWMTEKKATPLNRFFCFNHTDDGKNGCTYPQQLENYRALKLSPEYKVVDVDKTAPPYQHTRLLTSTRSVDNAHTAPLGDLTYKDVWHYLLSEPVE